MKILQKAGALKNGNECILGDGELIEVVQSHATEALERKYRLKVTGIEDPCSKLQGIFDRKECGLFYDSLAYPAASGGECARFCGSIIKRTPEGVAHAQTHPVRAQRHP